MNTPYHAVSKLTSRAHGEVNPRTGHRCVLANRRIPTGHVVAVFGGVLHSLETLLNGKQTLDPSVARVTLQVDEGAYLVSTRPSPADWINHSCEPNVGLRSNVVLVALRPILPGEEVCFDYATSDGSAYDEFECRCGAGSCRGRVTGDDWRRPELWRRYPGLFSPYLAARIERLREGSTARI